MRLFLAYAIDDTMKSYVRDIQEALRPSLLQGRQTKAEHLHLTLLFLGDQPGHRLAELESCLDEVLSTTNTLTCSTGMVGHFKQGHHALLYLSLKEGVKTLKQLHKRLKEALEERGFVMPKQAYTPHITIVRQATLKEDQKAHVIPQDTLAMKIKSLTLFHSYRHHDTLIHEPIEHFELLSSHIKG